MTDAAPPDLVQRLRTEASREQAVGDLYREFAGRLRRFYLAHRASPEAADDWVQETFVKVIAKLSSYRGDSPFAAWLWAIARNVMLDAIRREGRTPTVVDLDDAGPIRDESVAPEGGLPARDRDDCTKAQFLRFAGRFPERAQCISWAVTDGLSMSDIAGMIGRSVGATREFISQSLKKLREFLEPCLELLTE